MGYRASINKYPEKGNKILNTPIASPNIAQVITTIGGPRLGPYKSYFNCKTDEELLGAYHWGQAVSVAFQPTLGMYEVALRNSIHVAASRFSSKGASESHPWYDKRRTDALGIRGATTLEKLEKVLFSGDPPLRRSPEPVPDEVVASLSFGFWPSVLDGLTNREQPKILWEAFPNHPHSSIKHWSFTKNVQELITTLKGIQDLRNAVAHHEPIWKPHRLKGTEPNWSHCVVSLREKHADILRVMAWCCPEAAAVVQQSYATRIFKSICSTTAVREFMADPLGAGAMQLFGQNIAAVPASPAQSGTNI